MRENDTILVSFEVENQSNREGYETIQMYIQDLYGSVVRPVKELKAFKKMFFKPFETKKIQFKINTEMLKFWNGDLKYVVEDGEFKVFVGGNSADTLEEGFEFVTENKR